MPLLLFIMPGLWRNICPLAATHQLPRVFGFTRGLTLPNVVEENAFIGAIILFLTIVPLRHVFLNNSGLATAIFLLTVAGVAFLGVGRLSHQRPVTAAL